MDFQPEQIKDKSTTLTYYEDARKADGWEGQQTSKSPSVLEGEVFKEIARLGGGVISVQKGDFQDGEYQRAGYRILFTMMRDDGRIDKARLDVAALPCRSEYNKTRSLRMALYMLRNALKGMWFLRQLSPGLVPLMPFLLGKDKEGSEKTLSELYAAEGVFSKLLPSPKADFVEGEVIEIRTK